MSWFWWVSELLSPPVQVAWWAVCRFLSVCLSFWELHCTPPQWYRTTLCTTDLHCAPWRTKKHHKSFPFTKIWSNLSLFVFFLFCKKLQKAYYRVRGLLTLHVSLHFVSHCGQITTIMIIFFFFLYFQGLQAMTNFRNGSTGQLSFLTQLLLFLGACARIFTSYQETKDMVMVMTYMVNASFNGLIFFQVIYYWNVQPKTKIP